VYNNNSIELNLTICLFIVYFILFIYFIANIINTGGKILDPFTYINTLSLFGKKGGYMPGLARIKKLLSYLGNPEKDLKVIHLAGTNGKGSTAAFIECIYRKAGYKTALYTSPHFYHFNERIKVNGRAASTYELEEMIVEIRSAAEKLKAKKKYGEASFFEVVTALALLYFKRHQAEVVILETGLGGRLDATNVIKKPLLSIITNIDLEHTSILGNTVEEISVEKAGIIKDKSKVLTAVEDGKALKVIENKAAKTSSKLTRLDAEYDKISSSGNLHNNQLKLVKNGESKIYKLALLGVYQARNAALAVKTADMLKDIFPVSEENIRSGLASVFWPGRMQKIAENPLIIIDAAHNPSAFKKLADSIRASEKDFDNIHFIFSVLNDKNIEEMLNNFVLFKNKSIFYLAENSSFRTIKLDVLENKVKEMGFNYHSFDNLSEAAEYSYLNSKENDLIIAAGSFYTIFESGINFMTKIFRGGRNE
jgi:dihydrofolate synthase/folylpolyglutamate synthase